jgi:hypothetical protein
MLDFDRLKILAQRRGREELLKSAKMPVSPVAPIAATGAGTGLSHWRYSVTGATGQNCSYQENERNGPVAAPVAACSASVETFEFEIDEAEREAIAIELGGVPTIYASEFARLQAHPPAEVPRDRWRQFINDAGLFLDCWGRQAKALGWRSEELFGIHPDAPMARYDRMELVWMLKGERIVALTATEAKLSGGLTFYRKS